MLRLRKWMFDPAVGKPGYERNLPGTAKELL